jgi:transposase
VADSLSLRLVPDSLWEIVEPLIPEFVPRRQGGGTAPIDDRAVFTAIVFVLTTGCARRHLPDKLRGVATDRAPPFPGRRPGLGVGHAAPGDPRLARRGRGIDWSAAIVDGTSLRAKKGARRPARTRVDRGKSGSKIHVLTHANGPPLVLAVSGANVHDSQALRPLAQGIPAIRSRRVPCRRRPVKLRADKGYDHEQIRTWPRGRGITPRIARRGHLIAAFLALAAALSCWKNGTNSVMVFPAVLQRVSADGDRSAKVMSTPVEY